MDPASLEFWEWFYAPANEGASWSADQRNRAVAERWQRDLAIIQSPEMPGTAGEFRGYEGLAQQMSELFESWDRVVCQPRKVLEAGPDLYLVLIETHSRSRQRGLTRRSSDRPSRDTARREGGAPRDLHRLG